MRAGPKSTNHENKTTKISETQILARFVKIRTRENYHMVHGLVSRSLHVRQLLLLFVTRGDAFGVGRSLQKRLKR